VWQGLAAEAAVQVERVRPATSGGGDAVEAEERKSRAAPMRTDEDEDDGGDTLEHMRIPLPHVAEEELASVQFDAAAKAVHVSCFPCHAGADDPRPLPLSNPTNAARERANPTPSSSEALDCDECNAGPWQKPLALPDPNPQTAGGPRGSGAGGGGGGGGTSGRPRRHQGDSEAGVRGGGGGAGGAGCGAAGGGGGVDGGAGERHGGAEAAAGGGGGGGAAAAGVGGGRIGSEESCVGAGAASDGHA